MKRRSRFVILLLAVCLGWTSLLAEKSVTKTVTINRLLYPDKSVEELKQIALDKAKYAAAKEIFGEVLLSETVMANGKIVDEFVRERSGGVIHVRGNPKFSNGKNLGDIQCTIEAYATDEDIAATTPQTITLNDFKYTDPDVPLKQLKAMAEDAFIVEALSKVKPSLRYEGPAKARKLATGVDIEKMDFDVDTSTFTISGSVKYIPAFLEHSDVIETTEITDRFKPKPPVQKKRRRGFYGKWSGYIMRPDGGSSEISITIEDNGQVSIDFPLEACGGDLIVQEKSARRAEFVLGLTYGADVCEDRLDIVLQKRSEDELFYRAKSEDGTPSGEGSLFREEE